MSLLRQHFEKSFNIGFKILKKTPSENAHGQVVYNYEMLPDVHDGYLSTLKSQDPNRRVSSNDNLRVDKATHKLYIDLDAEALIPGDKILVIGKPENLNDQSLEIVHVRPQVDDNGAVDHLAIYVKILSNAS